MPSSNSSGTQLAVISTEHTIGTITTAGTFQFYVDTNAMALGDILELRAKVKVTSGGTTREFMVATYSQPQGQPIKVSIPIVSINEVVFTLLQTAGTGRSFPWEIVEL